MVSFKVQPHWEEYVCGVGRVNLKNVDSRAPLPEILIHSGVGLKYLYVYSSPKILSVVEKPPVDLMGIKCIWEFWLYSSVLALYLREGFK
jgi:hypothetical protein